MDTRNARTSRVLLGLLAVAIGAQGIVLASRWLGGAGAVPVPAAVATALGVGDTVSAVAGETRSGTTKVIPVAAGPGQATVVYAFHPECAYCDSIAPAWSRYASREDAGTIQVRRFAVTMDLPEPAGAYAARFGWKMDVLSMSRLTPADRDYTLLAKTPWIFVFDSAGVLRFQGHGADLEQAEDAVRGLGGGP